MSTRLSVDLLFLGLIGAAFGWLARAPSDPPARAAYLCAPVLVVADVAAQLEAAITEDEHVVAPAPPWRLDPGRTCMRVVLRVSEDLGY